MHYPSFAEYCDALSLNLGVVLSDPLLGRGVLRMRAPSLPITHGGTAALTFEVAVDGRTYAVRCFHKHVDALHARYEAIAGCLQSIRSPYFVDFEFQPAGITTESGTYPIVRLDWAEGRTLANFVAEHRRDADTLQGLRFSLGGLARHLQEHGVAHGDIQPGNIIVQDDTRLKLIDYDGLFVPQLALLASAELGQRNFQHPERRARHFDAGLDRFSFALLDLVLDALCREPGLWEQTHSDGDAFLLRSADFMDPASSPAFRLLAAVPGLEQRVRHFAAICLAPFEQVPGYEDFLAEREIPALAVEFTGDATQSLYDRYVSVNKLVDAGSFARCCNHVGDRVELIGRVVHVVPSHALPSAMPSLRLEFAEAGHDRVCVRLWPDAIAGLRPVPDVSRAGQWLSAVGLLEPVQTIGTGAHRQKEVSLSITDATQLHWLTEAEALHRLRGRRQSSGDAGDLADTVTTDRIVAEAEPQAIADVDPVPPAAGKRRTDAAANVRPQSPASGITNRGWLGTKFMVAASVVFVLAVLWIARVDFLQREQASARAVAEAALAAEQDAVPAPAVALPSRLESQQDLRQAPLPIATSFGPIAISTAADNGGSSVALLNGSAVPGLRDASLTLLHLASYTDRDVIVGITGCADADVDCGGRQPFWLELRSDHAPQLRRMPGAYAGAGAGAVAATDDGVAVDLGLWNGERRTATLTAAGNLLMSRTPEPLRPLDRADCAKVIQAAEYCTRSRECGSLTSSAQRMPPALQVELARLYHESTGFNGPAFSKLCVRSCELGLTPSRAFVSRNVCRGAEQGQWLADGAGESFMR